MCDDKIDPGYRFNGKTKADLDRWRLKFIPLYTSTSAPSPR